MIGKPFTRSLMVSLACVAASACGPNVRLDDPSSGPRSTYGYAPSPITAFADEITSIGLAALEGRPLPKVSFSLVPGQTGMGSFHPETKTSVSTRVEAEGEDIVQYERRSVDGVAEPETRQVVGKVRIGQVRDDVKLTLPVTPLAFAVKVEAALGPVGFDGKFWLDKKGLKVGSYEIESHSGSADPMPPSLSKLGDLFVPLLAAIRAAELPANMVSPKDIADLGRWARRRFAIPDMEERATYLTHLKRFSGTRPTGIELEELNVMVVDAKGNVAYLRLRPGSSADDGFGLRRLPLVRVDDEPDF